MIKYQVHYGPSLIIAMILFLILGLHVAFAQESKWELTPYVDMNGTIHGGLGDHYQGFASGVGFGTEYVYAMADWFGVGGIAKTNVNVDVYNDPVPEGLIVNEYWTWTIAAGGIVYMGDKFFMSAYAMWNVDTFWEDTYLHTEDDDIDMDTDHCTVDPIDYVIEAGLRVDYHAAVYLAATTHLVNTKHNSLKRQLYFGIKFFI